MQQRSHVLPFDDIVHICTDFYTLEEVKIGQNIIAKLYLVVPPSTRVPIKRKLAKSTMRF